jgi:hypothetical protein
MQQDITFVVVAHAIQLAVAPVFLLSGVGAVLVVLTNRLGRVIDRGRTLEDRLPTSLPDRVGAIHAEMKLLSHRACLIGRSITLCTITALLVCAVIATLFLGAFVRWDVSVAIALLFVAAMFAFFAGLVIFLREIFIATAALRIGPQ